MSKAGTPLVPVDIVYLFCHSRNEDLEICYSLRSVALNLPFVRKVWVLGDRPLFLGSDKSIVEHIDQAYVAPLLDYRLPVRNDFLLLFLASLIPELSFQFVRFSDDYIVLSPVSHAQLCTVRAVEDLNKSISRGRGPWRDQLWRTFDILKKYGYAGYNFESHTPQPYTRKLAFEAFMAFREFLSEDRHAGLVAPTTVYNYALKHQDLKFVWLAEDQSKVGFYGKCPVEEQIAEQCRGKLFLSFDDWGFGPPMVRYLQKLFPEPCKYERQ